MSADLIVSLIVFATVTSITPGPNNLMLLASGVNFGFRRTIPHMLGVGIGFMVMLALVGLGLGQIFGRFPAIYTAMKFIGIAYMLWLAWKIANSGQVGEGRVSARPMTFLAAAAFQWINPKAWVMSLSAATTYSIAGAPVWSALLVSLVFGAVNLPNVSAWALFGSTLRTYLNDPVWLRVFNWSMAALLVASVVPLIWL